MISYTTGDLLLSDADALVNTVNCEGYMGKGIAYQFKKRYPQNFAEYRAACQDGWLRPGKLLYTRENEKLIVNFPTKDKWKNKSEMWYIDAGLSALVNLIRDLHIASIAIPPLGAGNGGLVWSQVRELIERKLRPLADSVRVLIYGSSEAAASRPTEEPHLSVSALVLMEVAQRLKKPGETRLQKTCYFVNVFLGKPYFRFEKNKFGPYCHAIDIIGGNIKDFKQFHNLDSTAEAENILYHKIVSKTVERKMAELSPAIEAACQYSNSVETVRELEGLATVYCIVEANPGISPERLTAEFLRWSPEKAARFTEDDVSRFIARLYADQMIDRDIMGLIPTPQLSRVAETAQMFRN